MPRGHYKRTKRKPAESKDGNFRETRKPLEPQVADQLPPKTREELEERIRNQSDRIAMLNKELEVFRSDLAASQNREDRLERVIDKLTEY